MGCVTELANYFNYSPKRQAVLERIVAEVCPEPKKSKLKALCRTRYELIYSLYLFLCITILAFMQVD